VKYIGRPGPFGETGADEIPEFVPERLAGSFYRVIGDYSPGHVPYTFLLPLSIYRVIGDYSPIGDR
jgi:hypothetical protein